MEANTTLEDMMGQGWKDFVDRPKAVFWMSSNCQTPSRREEYVDELSKYIQVDKFGKCGDGEFTCGNPYEAFEETCWNTIFKKQYLFALAFENSLCNHYLSEKPYNPLIYGLVPIVWGGIAVNDYSLQEYQLITEYQLLTVFVTGMPVNNCSFCSKYQLASAVSAEKLDHYSTR
ncbi:alpha-(1,3)-fucosyltransferase 11-like [Macrobrachium nipponense]|uniref:alpha-(1,3)-fucosyltransferase 11-like n=1 Tax=Macrobrachium nipponense TaxID=159736 RepID=UPI0030C83978